MMLHFSKITWEKIKEIAMMTQMTRKMNSEGIALFLIGIGQVIVFMDLLGNGDIQHGLGHMAGSFAQRTQTIMAFQIMLNVLIVRVQELRERWRMTLTMIVWDISRQQMGICCLKLRKRWLIHGESTLQQQGRMIYRYV